jgi:antitoxin (DNA-binding transcriptional repressor) of toxin-antitoxin stability system
MKVDSIPFSEAKAHLSRYGRLAEEGQTTLVLKHRRSAFVIAPVAQTGKARKKTPGLAQGRIHLAPDFDATPEAVIRSFEGSS